MACLENVTLHPRDISKPSDVETVFGAVDHLDALVNNAGIADFGPIEDTDFGRWRQVLSINLDGT